MNSRNVEEGPTSKLYPLPGLVITVPGIIGPRGQSGCGLRLLASSRSKVSVKASTTEELVECHEEQGNRPRLASLVLLIPVPVKLLCLVHESYTRYPSFGGARISQHSLV